jgi:5'-3' exonuclease
MDEASAEWFFWKQVLTGDITDNIPGCPKIGEAKALKALPTGSNYYQNCLDLYIKQYKDPIIAKQELERNAKLLWIRRKEGEMWHEGIFKKGKGEESTEVGSTATTGEVSLAAS